jgi:hypothetical protein
MTLEMRHSLIAVRFPLSSGPSMPVDGPRADHSLGSSCGLVNDPSYSSNAASLAARRDSITIVPPETKAITQ